MIFVDNIPEYQENVIRLGEKIGLSEEQLAIIDLEDNRFMEEISMKMLIAWWIPFLQIICQDRESDSLF